MKSWQKIGMLAMALGTAFAVSAAPVTIEEQGSFAAGGSVLEATRKYDPYKPVPEAQTVHGDHAYVFYQIPVNAKLYPIVFLHGAGQSKKTWETTSDGRDGFQNIFLSRGFGVYLVDQPRRGDAGRSTVAGDGKPARDDQFFFGQFRMGMWPDFNEGTAFPKGEASLDQFFRQMTPNTGAYDPNVISSSLAKIFDTSGEAIFVTHSQGGGLGWLTAMKTDKVRAIVSYEPGSGFVFPEDEVPAPIENSSFFGPMKALGVPMADFRKLTKMPIVIYYGDYIPKEPTKHPHEDYWRACVEMAHDFADAVNRHGGDATVVELPDLGLRGNTHFPFSDLNNVEVADVLSKWLAEKNLD